MLKFHQLLKQNKSVQQKIFWVFNQKFSFSSNQDYNIEKNPIDDGMIILNPTKPHKKTLIWLHGLGDSALGFVNLFLSPQSPVSKDTRIILPTAPSRPVTINGGAPCNSWYDIRSLDKISSKDEDMFIQEQLFESYYVINDILGEELERVESNSQLYLGGFSQGCALALHTALNSPVAVKCVFGISGYFMYFSETKNGPFVKVRVAHGQQDETIPLKSAEFSYQRLKSECKDFKFKSFNGLGHNIDNQVLQFMKEEFEEFEKADQKASTHIKPGKEKLKKKKDEFIKEKDNNNW